MVQLDKKMTSYLVECLAILLGLVPRLDNSRASRDINGIEFLTAKTEEYLELTLLLSGKSCVCLILLQAKRCHA